VFKTITDFDAGCAASTEVEPAGPRMHRFSCHG
jgi:hypothetical protein